MKAGCVSVASGGSPPAGRGRAVALLGVSLVGLLIVVLIVVLIVRLIR